jgi:hypothetical protein
MGQRVVQCQRGSHGGVLGGSPSRRHAVHGEVPPQWLEEGDDGEGANNWSRCPSAWSERSTGSPWVSRRTRWHRSWLEVLSLIRGALEVAEIDNDRHLTMLCSGRRLTQRACVGGQRVVQLLCGAYDTAARRRYPVAVLRATEW